MTNLEEKVREVIKSNLSDELKSELTILLLKNENKEAFEKLTCPIPELSFPMYKDDGWVKRTFEDGNWWEKLRCEPSTGNAVEDWDPGREMWERAQADSVANHRVFYKTSTSIEE